MTLTSTAGLHLLPEGRVLRVLAQGGQVGDHVDVHAWENNRSSQPWVQEGRQALKILHIHGVEVYRKRPRGFK